MRRALFLLGLCAVVGLGAWGAVRPAFDGRAVRATFRAIEGPALLRVVDADATLLTARHELADDAPVAVGSGRKWMVAAVLLSLVDDGRLRLEDRVADHLPAWRARHRDAITVRQLLAHTSGMETRPPAGLCAGAGDLAGCVDRLALRPLLAAPGTRFRYSTAGFVVAARVAEVAGGRPWSALVHERMLDPLGMTSTRFASAGVGLDDMDGELWTTLPDWSRFLRMLLGRGSFAGRRVLSAAAVDEMLRGQTGGVPTRAAVPIRHWWPLRHDPYGLGVWRCIADDDDDALLAATKGRHGFAAWIDLRAGLGGAVFTQDADAVEHALVGLADATCIASGADCLVSAVSR